MAERIAQETRRFKRRWRGRKPGRKPKGSRPGVSHRSREELQGRRAVHVNWKVRPEVWNLRSNRSFRVILAALVGSAGRFGMRLTHYSVMGNHVHMIVEAESNESLARGMQGLGIRLAKGLNKLMGRHGTVFADRYHATVIRSKKQAEKAIAYVLNNARIHLERMGKVIDHRQTDRFAAGPGSRAEDVMPFALSALLSPRTWLLRAAPS